MEALQKAFEELESRAGLKGLPRAATVAALAVAVVLCGLGLVRWWPRAPEPELVQKAESGATGATSADAQTEATAEESAPAVVTVHVVGAVRREGVYALPAGSRAADGVEAAGGALGDAVLTSVNLARVLTDGEQLLIPDEDSMQSAAAPSTGGALTSASGAGAPGATAPGARVNVNTADAAALDTLPGVGPSTAEKILAEREANGPFASVDDLVRVSGIGPKRLEQLRGLVTVQ